jgi:hypothetical protein
MRELEANGRMVRSFIPQAVRVAAVELTLELVLTLADLVRGIDNCHRIS